jgi:hypothetical protein
MKQKQHHRAKLTADQVRAMRSRYVPGTVGYETLAAEFSCGVSTARDICTYRTRRDVTDEPTISTAT